MKILTYILVLTLSILLASCGADTSEHATTNSGRNTGSMEVIATINGNEIYEADLRSVLSDMPDEIRSQHIGVESSKQAVDSLLVSRVLSGEALRYLNAEDVAKIEARSRRYRENLLVSTYMQSTLDISLLDQAAIKQYYESNKEKLGAKSIKQYQLLTTTEKVPEESRDKFFSLVSGSKATGSLDKIQSALKAGGFNVQLLSGELDKDYVDQHLHDFINAQPLEIVSDLTFIGGKPYMVYLQSVRETPAMPLQQVSDSIRKTLVMQQLKSTLLKKTADILDNSDVVYTRK